MKYNSLGLRKRNTNLIRKAMLERDVWTKESLAEATGVSQATCYNILKAMLSDKEVLELPLALPEGGRPARQFRYNIRHFLFMLIFLKNEENQKIISILVTDIKGGIIYESDFKVNEISVVVLLKTASAILQDYPQICALGISFQGIVKNGKTGNWSTIEELNDVDLVQEFEARFSLPTVVENDVNLAAWGYKQKQDKNLDNLAYIAFPKGNLFGCGLVSDGTLIHGSRGFAGEILYLQNKTREEQKSVINSLSGKVETIILAVRSITALLDPEKIIIAQDGDTAEIMPLVKMECTSAVHGNFLPSLTFNGDYVNDGFAGLLDLIRIKFYTSMEES